MLTLTPDTARPAAGARPRHREHPPQRRRRAEDHGCAGERSRCARSSSNPPAELERQMTWEVLLWAPGIGRTRLRALNVRAIREGHVNLAAPLGALTERQRNWLAGRLCR